MKRFVSASLLLFVYSIVMPQGTTTQTPARKINVGDPASNGTNIKPHVARVTPGRGEQDRSVK